MVAHSRLALWRDVNRQLWWLGLLGLLSLTVWRALLFWQEAPADLNPGAPILLSAFWMGLRFDAKLFAVTLGPWLLLGTCLLPLPALLMRVWRRLWPVWAGLVMLLVNLLAVINHFYFGFYQGPLNALVFGLFEDDTRAVIATIINDYPVVLLFIVLAGMTTAQLMLMRLARLRRSNSWRWPRTALAITLSLVALIGLGRGSLGTFPLREMHMAVADNAFLNDLVPSGPQALYLAWKEREANDIGDDPEAGLKRYGFASPIDAAHAFGWRKVDSETALLEHLRQTTPRRELLEEKPPQVVFSLMESWGRPLLDFDDPESNDLLGRLRPWLMKADYFSKAISSENGTLPSLEGLLLDTPISPLTQSRYGYHSFSTSAVKPFQQAGYRTIFLTAGSVGWRNLGANLPRQGFDEVIGQGAIIERFPEATGGTWGVDDEWMYRYGAELLEQAEASGERIFLMTLSVTNHPPYRIPDSFDPAPLDIARLGDTLAASRELGQSILETYQYSSDMLGGFLSQLERDGLLDHTLFVASGDHNTRSILQYPDSHDLFDQFGVPILSWVPPAYRFDETPRLDDWVSHRDIFPTLWAHSLSGVSTPWMGDQLYTAAQNGDGFVSMALTFNQQDGGSGVMISDLGAATNLRNPRYYRWAQVAKTLEYTSLPSDALKAQVEHARARLALEDWRIRREALASKTR
ncbi:LTA synthase family protein [Pistricoccus aurantiacus]|uniref:LTA synthase family protein n=1 Tax=Pistricoccus aurantiacus TaxID=1883414 RepID=A0A5B8SUT1_9GAMM|nr:LTA synthase family protein [Pistricoccus aurantiacus]QEA40526.1 LTA synthase family protein [Pistricoccus aurantiacus]